MDAGKNILVTGGCGFIGSNFIHCALSRNDISINKLVNLDALTYAGDLRNLDGIHDPRYVFVQGNIGDGKLLGKILREHRINVIFNFAAESHVDRSIDCPSPFVQTNVAGAVALLDAALEYYRSLKKEGRDSFCFVQISTDEVYGSLQVHEPAFTEASRYNPSNPYAASKAAADHFAWSFHKTYGLPLMVSHCGNNYGPRQLPEKLIPLMILNAKDGKALPIYGNGTNIRDWIYVEDYAKGLLALLSKGKSGEVYHFGGGREVSNLEVVNRICDILDRRLPLTDGTLRRSLIRFVNDRPGHDFRYAMNTEKVRVELEWIPETMFEAGLEKTVEWYLEQSQVSGFSVRYERKICGE